MILFSRSDSLLTMPDEVLFVFFERHEPAEFLHGSGHGRQRLANFVSDRRGQTPKRCHALLRGDFLLETLQVREVLEIKYVAGGAAFACAKRRDRNSDETLLAIGCHEIHFAPLWQFAVGGDSPGSQKEGQISCMGVPLTSRNWLPVISSPVRFNRRMRPSMSVVEQSAAHGVNDVLVESLQVLQFAALHFEFRAVAAQLCARRLER